MILSSEIVGLAAVVGAVGFACGDNREPAPGDLPRPGAIVVTPFDDGHVDIADSEGTVYVRRGRAEVLLDDGSERTLSTTDCAGSWQPAPRLRDTGYFGSARGIERTCEDAGIAWTWRIYADTAHDTAIALVDITNTADATVTVLRVTPMITEDTDGGGLFVGRQTNRHRVLDDGTDMFREAASTLHYADEPADPLINALPIVPRGNVIANWNHAVVDLDGARSWVAGALTVERAMPFFGTSAGDDPPYDRSTDRHGFATFAADLAVEFAGKQLAPGQALTFEPVYLDPLAPDPFTGLEDYADAIAAWLDIVPWTRRGGGRPTPNGWNSWSGGSNGGLGTDIDESIMNENLAVMAREFEPYGIDYFQIDDGYERSSGDWDANPARFPSGLPALSQNIEDTGLIPGYWTQALVVDEGSDLATAHPDWLARPQDAFIKLGDQRVLDLSNDEVLGWLGDLMRYYRDDLDSGWVKLDFAYLAVPYRARAHPELSSIEAYRNALTTIRDALGPDVFLLGIAMYGLNFGIADGMRLTLDNAPVWEQPDPFDPFDGTTSFKTTVVSGARRYYFHDRVWVTHNDLLFFRTPPGGATVTPTEATTFASFIGLSGSIVKFGEDLRTLDADQINTWRKLLPIYPATARPMDLFTRQYPEQYRLPIDGTSAGSSAKWMVVGLLDWGRNYDLDAEPAVELADGPRSYSIDLGAWGLSPDKDYLAQEFWTGTFLGTVRGHLDVTVDAHDHAVIALREATDHPQFLGHNRHFTQGATDLIDEIWNPASRTLTIRLRVDAGTAAAVPFEYRVYAHAPPGFQAASALPGDGTLTQDGELVTYRFTPTAPGERAITIAF